MAYYFPILLIVTSNVLYHICAKNVPVQMNPMVSLGSLVANISLAVILIGVGILFYREVITVSQMIGIALCLAGLFFINRPGI